VDESGEPPSLNVGTDPSGIGPHRRFHGEHVAPE
jgi:hypothetical protein